MSSPPRLLGDAAVESSKMNIQRTFGFGKYGLTSVVLRGSSDPAVAPQFHYDEYCSAE